MSNINVVRKNLGPVTAYKYAVQQGYTGTEQEFAALMASYATVAEEAESARDDAIDAKEAAEAAQAAAEAAAEQAEGAIEVDDTLSVAGRAADAKKTGDKITGLKEDLSRITSKTTNLFDIKKLKAEGITVDIETASATGTGSAFYTAFADGIPLNIVFKENTQYSLKVIAKHTGEFADTAGLRFRFKHTDGSYVLMTFKNISTEDVERIITSTSGKTVESISINVGAIASNVWTVKAIQLNEGSSVEGYLPYSTAEDLIARAAVDALKKGVEDKRMTFSVIGDSYSAFPAWIPEGNSSYYPSASDTVKNVTQMWWYVLSKAINANPIVVDGWSGAKITTTEGSTSDSPFVKRIKRSMGEDRATEIRPDIIFILGGQNDTNANVPIGEPKYSDWTEEDLTEFSPAFCYMLDYLKLWNPATRIINLTNVGGISQEMQSAMSDICEHYSIENIVLSDIQKASHHPTAIGMQTIANIIANII